MKAILFALFLIAAPASGETILFVGNSFTFAALSPVQTYGPASVVDLNAGGIGGVPALFKRFADESGLAYDVSLETSPGKSLEWQWDNRRTLIDRRWDRVVLQDYSTLDAAKPGDARKTIDYAGRFARLVRARNPKVKIGLTATWSRPDLTYPPGKHWSGRPIQAMAIDMRHGADRARAANPAIGRVYPVGEAFNCAIAAGIADPNPYDGIAAGQIDLWAPDHYHASTAGYYLEALTLFASITGRDPRRLGACEGAAADLGISPELAGRLQDIAWRTISPGGCQAGVVTSGGPAPKAP